MTMHASQTRSLWQWVGEGEARMKWDIEGGYRVQLRLLSGEGKLSLLFAKCRGCGSNPEEMICPSDSNVSAQL